MIGAKLPADSRIWRKMAETEGGQKLFYAASAVPCDLGQVLSVPQNTSEGTHHFRTPSPGGQQLYSNTLLPALFSPRARVDARAELRPFRQISAHLAGACRQSFMFAQVRLSTRKTSKGKKSWALNTSRLRASQHLAFRPAETPWPNKRSSVARLAQVRLQSPAAASQLALRSGQLATSSPVSSTSPTADAGAFQHLTSSIDRRALLRGGFSRFLPNSSEGPCSKSF